MKYYLTIIILFSIIHTQPPDTMWTKTYGSYNDFGLYVQNVFNGGYIITGYTDPHFHADSFDIFLLRVDSAGNQKWFKSFGGPAWDCAYGVDVTPDQNYIIVGSTRSYGNGGSDVYLIKTDSTGKLLWSKTFGGNRDDAGTSIDLTLDKGYLLGGHTWSFNNQADFYLVKTDSMGNKIWEKTYGGENNDIGNMAVQTFDGGYIMVGHSQSFKPDSWYIYLVKTDAEGEKLWSKEYPYNESKWGHGFFLKQTTDRGYIITGSTWPSNERKHDLLVIKTDAKGNILWQKTFGDTNNNVGKAVLQTSDGGYILSGYTCLTGMVNANAWLIKINSKGDRIWSTTFPGRGQSWSFSVQQTSDYGYILTGKTYPGDDIFLVKTQPDLIKEEKTPKRSPCLIPLPFIK